MFEFVRFCTILRVQIGQKVVSVSTWFFSETQTSSISTESSLFPSKCISIAYFLKQTVRFRISWNWMFTSEWDSWLARCDKTVFSWVISWNFNPSFRKRTHCNCLLVYFSFLKLPMRRGLFVSPESFESWVVQVSRVITARNPDVAGWNPATYHVSRYSSTLPFL